MSMSVNISPTRSVININAINKKKEEKIFTNEKYKKRQALPRYPLIRKRCHSKSVTMCFRVMSIACGLNRYKHSIWSANGHFSPIGLLDERDACAPNFNTAEKCYIFYCFRFSALCAHIFNIGSKPNDIHFRANKFVFVRVFFFCCWCLCMQIIFTG